MKLDRTDLQILAILQTHGRITKVALAEKVNLSPTPCWTRLKRLEQAGVIEGYQAVISAKALGPAVTVYTEIGLATHRKNDFHKFETAVMNIPEIRECWSLGGGIDYLLKTIVKHIDNYQQLIDDLLDADLGVDRYFTYIVTKPVKNLPGLPLYALAAGNGE
ncbi:MAG: Lrp/AsnC family transcriptional regulator [Gammaproteobacteria bacterium]|nr:Lrp/AsnC family transcriptional regulator [Gammaproteobacteria bacterium]